jgi:hypothetical protein
MMKRKRWKLGVPVGAAMLLLAACGVSNPGTFTTTVLGGSSLTLTDAGGTPTLQFAVGVAACSDGRDNDIDSRIDSGSDPQCDSADDANERLDGVQAYEQPTWVMEVDSGGAITVDPASVDFQQLEECINVIIGIWCMGITIAGTGDPLTGTISPADGTIELGFRVNVEIDGITGFPGLSPDCAIGPIAGTLEATDYDEATGEATLAVADMPVPAVSGCGSSGLLNYDTLINDALSLPGQADLNFLTHTLDAGGNPVS